MRKLMVAGLLIGSGLGGCGEPTVETERSMAKALCFGKAFEILQPEHPEWESQNVSAEQEQLQNRFDAELDSKMKDSATFRFVSTAQFVIDFGKISVPPSDGSFTLQCTGDFNLKTLTSVQIDGKLHRPKPGELWSF